MKKNALKLCGSIVAIVTPMTPNEAIDFDAFEHLLRWQLDQGCDGIVVSGSTGEAATLTFDEKVALFACAKKIIADRVPLIAATGTNCTRSTLALTQAAADLDIRYTLLVCPYYNKPTQRGLLLHYQAIAEKFAEMQHILYAIPGRSVIPIATETVIELSTIKNIIGLKDSGSSSARIRQLRAACPAEFSLLAGDDDFTLDCILNGGDGVISVVANVLPQEMHALVQAARAGDVLLAHQLNSALGEMYRLLFCQSNPIPVKALLYEMKKIDQGIRLPLTWLDQPDQAQLFEAYQKLHK